MLGRHFGPPKMVSGRGFGKNLKIQWKMNRKMCAFWWLRTTFGAILFAYFTLLPFSKRKTKNQCKKVLKSVVFFFSKICPWASQGRLIGPFWSFHGSRTQSRGFRWRVSLSEAKKGGGCGGRGAAGTEDRRPFRLETCILEYFGRSAWWPKFWQNLVQSEWVPEGCRNGSPAPPGRR